MTADKYTPRKLYSLKTSNRKVNPKDRSQGKIPTRSKTQSPILTEPPTPPGSLPNHNPPDRPLNHMFQESIYPMGNPTPETAHIDFVFSNLSIFRKYNTICRVFINTFAKQSSGTTYDFGKVLKNTEQNSCTTLEALTKLISVFLTNGESVSWTPTQPIILIHPSITPCDVTWVHVRKKLVVEMEVCSWTLTQPIILIHPSITPCDVTWVHVRKRLVVEMETEFTDTRTSTGISICIKTKINKKFQIDNNLS